MKVKVNKKIAEAAFSVISLCGSWIIASKFMPALIVKFTFFTIFAHEYAHYFIAKKYNADPKLPFFVYLGITIFGATDVKRLHKVTFTQKQKIVQAGFISGLSCALTLSIYAFIYNPLTIILPLSLTMIYEIYAITFGEDSKQCKTNARKHSYSAHTLQT